MRTKTRLNLRTLLQTVVILSLVAGQLGLMSSSVGAANTSSSVSPSGIFFEPALQLGADGSAFMQPFAPGSQWTAGDNAVDGPIMDGYNSMYDIPAPAKSCVKRTIDSVTLKVKLISGEVAPAGIGFMDPANPASAVGTNFIQEPQPAMIINPDFHFGNMEANGTEMTFVIAPTSPKTYDQLKIVVGIDDREGRSESLIYGIEDFSIKVSDDDSACPNTNPVISPTSVTIPSSTVSGSTVVAGTKLKASDEDGDSLKLSIISGNGLNYFAIDSTTGNITTAQTNIPAGTYTLTVQVDDGRGGTSSAEVEVIVSADGVVAKTTVDSGVPSSVIKVGVLANTGSSTAIVMAIAILSLSGAGLARMKGARW